MSADQIEHILTRLRVVESENVALDNALRRIEARVILLEKYMEAIRKRFAEEDGKTFEEKAEGIDLIPLEDIEKKAEEEKAKCKYLVICKGEKNYCRRAYSMIPSSECDHCDKYEEEEKAKEPEIVECSCGETFDWENWDRGTFPVPKGVTEAIRHFDMGHTLRTPKEAEGLNQSPNQTGRDEK